jgi:RimJ/RimL family protein N-acetyltransferase
MRFNHQYLGYEPEDQRDIYTCNITDDYGLPLGYCKYYKPMYEFDIVYIEYIQIYFEHRRHGYATEMVKELQKSHTLKWNGRFSSEGRKWYNSLMERQLI